MCKLILILMLTMGPGCTINLYAPPELDTIRKVQGIEREAIRLGKAMNKLMRANNALAQDVRTLKQNGTQTSRTPRQ